MCVAVAREGSGGGAADQYSRGRRGAGLQFVRRDWSFVGRGICQILESFMHPPPGLPGQDPDKLVVRDTAYRYLLASLLSVWLLRWRLFD